MNETFGVKDKVLRLDISVNDLLAVHKFQPDEDAGRKVPSLLLTELVLPANVVAEVTARHQVHHQVESVSVLEGLTHVDDEFVL